MVCGCGTLPSLSSASLVALKFSDGTMAWDNNHAINHIVHTSYASNLTSYMPHLIYNHIYHSCPHHSCPLHSSQQPCSSPSIHPLTQACPLAHPWGINEQTTKQHSTGVSQHHHRPIQHHRPNMHEPWTRTHLPTRAHFHNVQRPIVAAVPLLLLIAMLIAGLVVVEVEAQKDRDNTHERVSQSLQHGCC